MSSTLVRPMVGSITRKLGARFRGSVALAARACSSEASAASDAVPGTDVLRPDVELYETTMAVDTASSIRPPITPVLWGTSMKALVKTERKPGLTLTNMPKPAVGPNEVLIKTKKTAICGTDVHIHMWNDWAARTIPTPMIVGHEYVGVISELGSEVTGLEVGQRVTGEGHVTCGYCRNCRAGRRHLCRNTFGVGVNRPGAFAEYLTLPAFNVFPLHKDVPDDIAAFMDALGNGVHTALSFDLAGEDVLITGAGPIGVMAAAVCKQVGARNVVITDINDYRLDLARQCGATVAVNTKGKDAEVVLAGVMRDLGMTEGFDVGLEMAGVPSALHAMLATVNVGAKVALLGIPSGPFEINWDHVIFKGLEIKGIYGREMFETWYKMQSLIISGLDKRIEPVITHRMSIDRQEEGFDHMITGMAGKVILSWE